MKRTFSEIDVLLIAGEISKSLKNKKVKRVSALERGYIIHFSKEDLSLVVVSHPNMPHFYLTDAAQEETEGHRFSPLLEGFRLSGIKVPEGERIVYLKFQKRAAAGTDEHILAIELTGKHSNSCVIDGQSGRIMAVLRPSTRLQVDKLYFPPPSRGSIFQGDEQFVKKAVPWLYEEFTARYGEFNSESWRDFIKRILSHPEPVVYFDDGKPVNFSPIKLVTMKEFRECTFETYSQAVEAFYSLHDGATEEDEEEKLRRRLQDELRKLSDFEKYRRWGELIMAHLNEIPSGASRAVIQGEEIPLDIAETPIEAAQKYFEIYKKRKRGVQKLMEKLQNLHVRSEKKRKNSKTPSTSKPYREFLSPGGFKVYVGKSARGNELVTFGIASDHDLFFHVRNVPGAHVILKRDSENVEVPEEDIKFAAALALKFSRAAMDGRGDVSFTERRYVKKPRNAPPGLVIIEKERTIRVKLD